jgi:hypothetical protein
MAAFRSSHATFLMLIPLAPRAMQYACTQSSTHFSRILSVARRKRGAYRSPFLVRVLLPFSPLGSFTCFAAESTKNTNPEQYLLSVEQIVENDYPVPSYLADVFQKPEWWIETSQVAADEGFHTVYAIDCEMVRILNPRNSLK